MSADDGSQNPFQHFLTHLTDTTTFEVRMMSRWTKVLMLAAVVAIAVAQVRGVRQGYICDCTGVTHLTKADHCHGELPADQHDDHDDHGHADHTHDESHSSGETHDHGERVTSLLAKTQTTQQVELDGPLCSVLPLSAWLQFGFAEDPATLRDDRDEALGGSDPPPWPQWLAHSISLRI
jgi:hypothetical protein